MFQGDIVREGSNNFSPSQGGEFCLDQIQRMTVFDFSDIEFCFGAREFSFKTRNDLSFSLFPL